MIYFFYDIFTWENGLRAALWCVVLSFFLWVIANIYMRIKNDSNSASIVPADSQGRYPIIKLKTRIGTILYDKDNAFGLHIIRKDGTISTVDTPDLVLNRHGQIEVARADAFKAVPTSFTYTNSPADTYAPTNSREATLVDNDGGGDNGMLMKMLDAPPKKEYPKFIDFFDHIEKRDPGYIMIGINSDETIVQVPIGELFHQIIGGQSGFGKSAYLRSLTLQLLLEAQTTNLRIGLADIENNTFPEFRDKEHVHWYAGNYLEIEQMTKMLLKELEHRKKLYEEFKGGTPKDIERYNVLARRDSKPELPIIVVLYDEFTALMNRTQAIQKRIISDIYQLALRARKYGIFLVIAGHSFKADVLDSTVVGQFGFNICFRVRTVHTSISVLGEGGAENINEPGVALIRTKGGDVSEIKGFYLDDDALIDYLDTLSSEETHSSVPELVKQIVVFCYKELENKVLIKNLETHFRDQAVSRIQLIDALKWMDENSFVYRGDKNARLLDGGNRTVIDILDTETQ